MPPEIPVCLSPDRNPRKPDVLLPEGSVDTHIHIFEPAYALTPDRGYTPPEATLEQLKDMHDAVGVDRVVFTQPSVSGTDKIAMMEGVDKLNAKAPGTARAVVSCNTDITDPEIEAFDARGARGLRFNMDNAGGMSVSVADLPALAERIAPFGWHMEFLFAGRELFNLVPVFADLPVPVHQRLPRGLGHALEKLAFDSGPRKADPELRLIAVEALGAMNTLAAQPDIAMTFVDSPATRVRAQAAAALRWGSVQGQEAALWQLLADEDPFVATAAAKALLNRGSSGAAAIDETAPRP